MGGQFTASSASGPRKVLLVWHQALLLLLSPRGPVAGKVGSDLPSSPIPMAGEGGKQVPRAARGEWEGEQAREVPRGSGCHPGRGLQKEHSYSGASVGRRDICSPSSWFPRAAWLSPGRPVMPEGGLAAVFRRKGSSQKVHLAESASHGPGFPQPLSLGSHHAGGFLLFPLSLPTSLGILRGQVLS